MATLNVSIRARHVCRAMLLLAASKRAIDMFQSAPGTCAGRCKGGEKSRMSELEFQSAPGTCAGRCSPVLVFCGLDFLFQSAPGTCAGRCHPTCDPPSGQKCFNPRPARVPGDALTPRSAKPVTLVSIRARHVCRAMPVVCTCSASEIDVSIRARHVCRAMPTRRMCWPMPPLFQSAPGTCAGRCEIRSRWQCVVRRFNPRPARVPGDAALVRHGNSGALVSIRARHVCRAMRAGAVRCAARAHVSIRARHVCRAMPRSARAARK